MKTNKTPTIESIIGRSKLKQIEKDFIRKSVVKEVLSIDNFRGMFFSKEAVKELVDEDDNTSIIAEMLGEMRGTLGLSDEVKK